MTDVLLLHHAQGRTTGVAALADRLRDAGHSVAVPDLFEGRTFPTLEEGLAHADRTGFGTIRAEGVAAAGAFAGPFAVVGISMGVMAAQELAQTNPHVVAAVLIASCLPPQQFGPWPAAVPVQVHGGEHDRVFTEEGDLDAAREVVESASAGELFLYPTASHLFVDASLPESDPGATDEVVTRTLALLGRR